MLLQVTLLQDSAAKRLAAQRTFAGPSSDILTAAISPPPTRAGGSSYIAAGAQDGEVWVWGLEGGGVPRQLVPAQLQAQLQALPENARPVERVTFMHGSLRWVRCKQLGGQGLSQ